MIVAGLTVWPACALELPPHKDAMFSYPGILETRDGGAYRVVDYREQRDINGRDEVPELRAAPKYLKLAIRRKQKDVVAETDAGPVAHFAVGASERAAVIVIYVHGKGGNRKQGVNDLSFGGNFNRLKNLVVAGGGLYLSPDFADFAERGASQIAGLAAHYAARSPGAPVYVACGSMGGAICYSLAAGGADRTVSGYLWLGSFADGRLLGSAAVKARKPLFFAQGSADKVFPIDAQEQLYADLRARARTYPVRFVRFETGSHGTPIRMVDWRETLNWMLSLR